MSISLFSKILSILTISGQILVVLLLANLIFNRNGKIIKLFGAWALPFSFMVAVVATAGSLSYSEIFGLVPCKLCWFQRILMYPQVILLGLALWKKDKDFADYSLGLTLPGILVAAYHYYGQMFAPQSFSCSVVGLTPSCSDTFFVEFGYITIPMMSFTAFVMITTFLLIRKYKQ